MEASNERLLILAVDIDNDLHTKTKIAGPIIGRNPNLVAASKLALADPQETDANTMFEAVKKYDEMKAQGYKAVIATVTGAEDEGYIADRELARQIDMLIDKFKVDACILVTDGASDMRVVPILKSRIKVNSVDIVRMKQAEQFENAYFAVLEKLKEPHYARIVFGIPAVLLILFSISYYLNLGWQLPVMLIGIYLIIKGVGVEESLLESVKKFGFSIERFSFVLYISAIAMLLIAIIVGYGSYTPSGNMLSSIAIASENFLILFSISLIFYSIGRIIDYESKKMMFKAIKQGVYLGYGIVGISLLYITSAWIIGQIYFWQLLAYAVITIGCGYAVSLLSSRFRILAIKRAKLSGKEVINDIGAYVGKIVSVQHKSGSITIKTDYGNTITYDIDRITGITDKVIIR